MRILFIGDYSNLHATLAEELRKRGNEVTVMSDGCGYLGSHTDLYISREKGLLGGIKYLYNLFNLLPSLKDYDVVQFINPNFLSLRPGKIKYFFDRLKAQNGKMFLTLAGDDYYFCKACLDGKVFRYSEFKIGDEFTEFHKSNPNRLYGWTSYANRHWNEYFYEKIDGAMSVLPEYDMVAKQIIGEKTTFTNLPVDLSILPIPVYNFDSPLSIFFGIRPGMEIQKGIKKLLNIAKEIESEKPELIKIETVSGVSLREFIERMKNSHIVLDQLYAYSPATTALYAMGMGKVACTGAQPEYYEYLGNPDTRPVFSLSPFDTDIKERLMALLTDQEKIKKLGQQSRTLVETHNDVKKVTDKFIKAWDA